MTPPEIRPFTVFRDAVLKTTRVEPTKPTLNGSYIDLWSQFLRYMVHKYKGLEHTPAPDEKVERHRHRIWVDTRDGSLPRSYIDLDAEDAKLYDDILGVREREQYERDRQFREACRRLDAAYRATPNDRPRTRTRPEPRKE